MLAALIMSYVCAAAFGLSGVATAIIVSNNTEQRLREFAIETDRESNQKWCDLLTPIDEGYKQHRPNTAAGVAFAKAIHARRIDFGC